jgi:hypothetical protein
MRAAPAVGVTIHRSPRWIGFIALLLVAAMAGLLAWAVSSGGLLRWLAVAAAVMFGGAVFAFELRSQPVGLRWDRQCWQLDSAPFAAVRDERACELGVAIDLGGWMLLRLTGLGGRPARTWLAVQRGSTRGDWHALRCAVYSPRPPRPAETGSPASDPTLPPA